MLLDNLVTLEDLNSILLLKPDVCFDYEIDCSLLPSTNFNETYYDFNTISMSKETSGDFKDKYHYVLKVYNKLWTGGISFKDIPSEEEEPLWYTDISRNYNNELYIVHILTDYTDFKILLTLDNNNDEPRPYVALPEPTPSPDPQPVYVPIGTFGLQLSSNDLSYYYYESKSVTFTAKDSKGSNLSNVSINITNPDGTKSYGVTNSNGQLTYTLPSLMPKSKYTFKVEANIPNYNKVSTSFNVTVKKEKPTITLDQQTGYWGGYCTDTVKISTRGTNVSKLKTRILNSLNQLGTDKTVNISRKNNLYSYDYEESYRTIRKNSTVIKVIVNATDYTEKVEKTFTKSLSPKTITSWANLKAECNNSKGVDYVRLTTTNYNADEYIPIKRNMEIVADMSNDGWAVIRNSTNYAFSIKSPSTKDVTLTLKNIKFHNNKGTIYCHAYSKLNVTNCYFTHNRASGDIGACIKTPINDTYTKKNYGTLTLTKCYFYNNKGSTISTSMNTTINHAKIILTDWDYAQHPQAYGLEVYGQSTTVKDTDFICDMGTTRSPLPVKTHSNFSHGKAALRVSKKAILNNKKGSEMVGDNKSSLLSHDNTSYLYARYKYDGVNVTASAKSGYEKKCFDHIINGVDWAYKTHTVVSSTHDNTKGRPTINLPDSSSENDKKWK